MGTCSLLTFHSKIKNVFWKDVFKAWQSYKTSFEKEINIRTYPLWDTYFLTNTNIINRKFQSKGINIINDLLHVSGGLMGLDDFNSAYDININFVDFYSLTHCLPRSWRENFIRHSVKLKESETVQPVITDLLQMSKACKGTYWKLIKTVELKPNHRLKWSESLQNPISEEDMSEN